MYAANGHASASALVDSYTHFAPPKLLKYLEERAGRPLVFGKVSTRTCGVRAGGLS
jgi:hypothetical protein